MLLLAKRLFLASQRLQAFSFRILDLRQTRPCNGRFRLYRSRPRSNLRNRTQRLLLLLLLDLLRLATLNLQQLGLLLRLQLLELLLLLKLLALGLLLLLLLQLLLALLLLHLLLHVDKFALVIVRLRRLLLLGLLVATLLQRARLLLLLLLLILLHLLLDSLNIVDNLVVVLRLGRLFRLLVDGLLELLLLVQ